jgi:F-type H+-transporting ATPase subunit delta
MNTGIITSRYARALLEFVDETGHGDVVCGQVLTLESALDNSEELRRLMDDPAAVTDSEKLSLLKSALGNAPMADELERFIKLILKRGRMEYFRQMLHTFVAYVPQIQRESRTARLVSAVASPELEAKLKALVKEKTGDDVILETKVDPSVIGGFIFIIDDYMIDASVSHQLEILRHQFVEKNRRIV